MIVYLIIFSLILILGIVFYKFPLLIVPAIVLSIPLQRYNYHIDSFGLSVKLIMIILPAIYMVIFLQKKKFEIDKSFLFFSLLIIFGQVLSFVDSINHFRTFSVIAFQILLLSLVLLIVNIVRKIDGISRSIYCLIIAGSIVSFLSLWQFGRFTIGASVELPFESLLNSKTIEAEAFEFNVGGNSYLRPSSTFVDVNITAGFLIIIVLITLSIFLYYLFTVKKVLDKSLIISLSVFLLNLTSFLLTVSRSAYLGLAVAGILFCILNYRILLNKRLVYFLIFSLLILFFIIYFFDTPIEAMWNRFQDTFLRHDISGSTQEHNLFSQAAFNIFKEHPLFGIGAGNFEEYYLTWLDNTEDTAYTYNIYLSFLCETGIVGFLTQLSFIVFIIKSSLSHLFKMKNLKSRLIYSSLIVSYIGILIANLFYSYYILFFVWLLTGIIASFFINNFQFEENEK